jgi:uncharacterized membrane protein YfcA
MHVNIYLLAPVVLLTAIAGYLWWSQPMKTRTRTKRAMDRLFLWPLLLKGTRTKREKTLFWIGLVVAITPIALAQTLPKP